MNAVFLIDHTINAVPLIANECTELSPILPLLSIDIRLEC